MLNILFFICLLVGIYLITSPKRKREKLIKHLIDVKELSYTDVNRKIKILNEINKEFYGEMKSSESLNSQYKNIISNYPNSILANVTHIEELYSSYKSKNIDKEALLKIKKILYLIELAERQSKYFKEHLTRVHRAKSVVTHSNYNKEFPKLFEERKQFLDNTLLVINNSINAIETDIVKFQVAIKELEQIKKKHLLVRGAKLGFRVLTAPVRHVINIVDGIDKEDGKRVGKGIFMLTTSLVGLGVVADALELFEGGASFGSSDSGAAFVDPHERVLPSGETTWIDGDGNSSVNLTKAEGGGYWRS